MQKKAAASFSLFTVLVLICMNTFSYGQDSPQFEWAKHIGGSLGETAKKMQVDGSRNVYLTGQFGGTVDFDPGAGNTSLTSAGGNDIFACKFDENGNLIWAKSFGSANSEYVNDIEIDNAGNVHLTGYFDATVDFDPGAGTFNITPIGSEDVFIVKLDNNGDFAWAGAVGGTNYEEGFDIDTDNSGNVFITGYFQGTVDFNPGAAIFNLTSAGQTDSFVLKLDNSGNFAWARVFGGTETERGRTIAIDAAGNIIATGGFYGYTTSYDFDPGAATVTLTPNPVVGQWDIYVCKMSPVNGDITWAKSISGTLWDIDQEIFIDNADNILLTGYHEATTDFDPGPATFDLTASGISNAFVLKLNSSGDFIWAKSIGGTGIASNRGYGIVADNVGNVYVSPAFQNTTDLDPGPGTFNITAKGSSDIGVIKLDAAGNFVWAYSIGGTGGDAGFSIALDNLNKIYLTGIFSLTVDFDPGTCTFNFTSGGFVDTFLQKMTVGPAPAPPTISSFSPTSGPSGTVVTISGTNFSTTPANNVVAFNGIAAVVTASSATSITTTVPASATTGEISVTVNCMTVQSATNFTIGTSLVPTITSFTPASAPVGTTVTITGTNFDTTPANNIVYFGATRATVTTSTATQLTVTVPAGATYARITELNATTDLLAYSMSNFTPSFSPSKGSITVADFEPKVDFTTGSNPLSVSIGDLDGDGKSDLAVANTASNTISILRNTSTGTGNISYAAKVDFPADNDPESVLPGDFDGDGKVDLAVANYIGFSVSVFRNTSTGAGNISYAPKIDFATGFTHRSGTIADFDGDGKVDIVTANDNAHSVSVLRNTSTGPGNINYATKIDFSTGAGSGPYSISVGDVDGDAKSDIIAPNFNLSTVSILRNTSTGEGDISFAAKVDFTTGANPISVSVGDLDGDGKLDLAIVNKNSNTISIFRNTSTGTGNISYAAKVDFPVATDPRSVSMGDLDGDSKADLAIANDGTNAVSVLRNISTGLGNINFAPKIDFTTGTSPRYVSIGDSDGDGKSDIVTANASGNSVSVIRNNPVFSSITINSQPVSAEVCEGSVASFTLTASGTTNLTYQWQKFDGSVFNNISNTGGYAGATTPTLAINTSGNFGEGDYRCSVSGDNTPTVFSQTVSLTFTTNTTVAEITVDGSTLTASPGDTYQWYQNGEEITGATNQTLAFNALEYGLFTVAVTDNGCTDMSDEFTYLITGFEKNTEGLKVYPNPVEGNLFIEFRPPYQIQVIGMPGNVVHDFRVVSVSSSLDFTSLSKGVYFLKVTNETKTQYIRIVKK